MVNLVVAHFIELYYYLLQLKLVNKTGISPDNINLTLKPYKD